MNNQRILLISPASLFDPKDPFTTGVVYMPIGLAYAAAVLEKIPNVEIDVLDLFGESPNEAMRMEEYIRLGLSDDEIQKRVDSFQPHLVIFYANQLINHNSLIESIKTTRSANKELKIGVAENTQAVTAYLLNPVAHEFFDAGVDVIISGEIENTLPEIIRLLKNQKALHEWNLDGVSTTSKVKPKLTRITELDQLPIPAWHYFPLNNYWKLGYAHGPFETETYLPLLTSRGCPFPCNFCVVPSTNNRKWRFRSAQSVVDEIEYLSGSYAVKEFHLEDLNPTIQDSRMREIAEEILNRNLKVKWKIVAGTKVESIKSVETLKIMHKSGLSYLSISPESGSKKILREIGKPFDVNHALRMIKESYRIGVKTQACFVLGYPGESNLDRLKSFVLAIRLTAAGIDEIVVFIITPVPGSSIFDVFKGQYQNLSSLNFSPRWRIDFGTLFLWRIVIYFFFLLVKFWKNPIRMFKQIRNLINGNYQTKMEMTPIRGLKYKSISRKVRRQRKRNRLSHSQEVS